MHKYLLYLCSWLAVCFLSACQNKSAESTDNAANIDSTMIVRISEIEVYPEYLKEYLEFAHNISATSVKEEPGVICIFPMQQQKDSCQIRILEIYASQKAYQHHIQTSHFQTYKQGTLHMVKSLDLVDMHQMAPECLPLIFNKAVYPQPSPKGMESKD